MGFSRVDRGNPRVRKLTAKATRGGVVKRGKRVVKRRGLREHLSRLTEENANSETSDTADLTADINWEDNTGDEISSLMEAFCPPVNHVEDKPTSSIEEPTPADDESLYLQVSDVASLEQVNSKVLVQTYNETEWVKGVVTEVDCDENEVLVHFEESGTDEWLSVKSQRIKFLNEGHKAMMQCPVESQSTTSITIKPKNEVAEIPVDVNLDVDVDVDPPASSVPSPSLKRSVRKKIPGPKFASKLKTLVGTQVKMSKRTLAIQAKNKRRLPTWKTQKSDMFTQKALKNKAKFKEGEKVLAKWSDHRMQKFPAVIKKISGPGQYDVLFYDGFEKTITEDNIYKGTEEEIAKYKHSKPSEADNFVDMDIASKEERRMKKKKTFDDYFSDKDLRRRRRTFESSNIDLPMRGRNYRSGLRESLASGRDASPSTDGSDIIPAQSIRVHVNKMSKKVVESLIQSDQIADSTPNFPETNAAILPTEKPELPADTIASVSQSEQSRADANLQNDGKPPDTNIIPVLVTCHDGRQRKSIVISDSDLPFGWSKHVIAWLEGAWASFLITPDGYSLHSMDELKRYYAEIANSEPPSNMVFSFPKDKIKEIAESQKGIPPSDKYKKWLSKYDEQKKLPKRARTLLPNRHLPLKRVRTLLPKHRSGPSGVSKPQEGRLWKCPKEGCDKQFRKENLLQMHIKHYHSEFKALAGSAPKVVDLAQARSAETWSSSHPRSTPTIKRLLPKSSASHEPNVEKLPEERQLPAITKHSPKDYNPSYSDDLSIPSDAIMEEKPSIKTLVPLRSPRAGSSREYDGEFMDVKIEPGTSSDPAKGTRGGANFPKKLSEPRLMEETKDYHHGYFKSLGSRGQKRRRYFHHTEKLHVSTSNDSFPEEEKPSPGLEYTEDGVVIERLKSEEVINCSCGFREEDGLMIQCEICLCWQHGACHGIESDRDVPNNYVCQTCLNPPGVRSSQKYMYAWQFLTQGKLSRFSKRTCNEDVFHLRQRTLARSFELTGNIRLLEWVSRGIANKLSIAEQPDHPKLYMWSANWADRIKTEIKSEDPGCLNEMQTNVPVPEAPIDMDDCRSRLMDDIEHSLQEWDNRLTSIQAQLAALEAEDADLVSEDHLPLLKQAIYMLLRDLVTAKTAVAIS